MKRSDAVDRGGDEGWFDRILHELQDVDGPDIVQVGRIPGAAIAAWLDRATDDVVITRERRRHYLERHPDMESNERRLIQTLLDPAEIHVNRNDPRMAIFYDRINEELYLRISVWISDRRDRQNSVLSMRRARSKEIQDGRIFGRVRWKK